MIIQDIHTMDELLHFVSGLTKKHGLKLWYRGEENSELSLIPQFSGARSGLTWSVTSPTIFISGQDRL